MLRIALIFLTLACLAAFFGFGPLGDYVAAQLLFVVLFVLSFLCLLAPVIETSPTICDAYDPDDDDTDNQCDEDWDDSYVDLDDDADWSDDFDELEDERCDLESESDAPDAEQRDLRDK